MSDHSEKDFWGEENSGTGDKEPKTGRLLVLALVVVFVAFAVAGFKLANQWLGNSPIVADGGDEQGEEAPSQNQDNRLNILLLGTDQRNNEPARADTVILAFLDLDEHQIKMLSIPRDTYVQIPGYGREKLAHANAYGGPQLTVETVENLLNVEIDRYVEINFEGFKEMIDTLGGIEMEVEKRMYYPDEGIDLHPGLQRLDGYNALAYVRFRSDSLGDIGRINRQQKFLKELAEETLQLGTVLKLPELITEASQSIKTDISAGEMLSLARAARSFDTTGIEAATLPGTSQYINEISYWVPTGQDVEEIIKQYTSPSQTAQTTTIDTTLN